MTSHEYEGLAERLAASSAAFREHTLYDSDGDPLLLIVQADEMTEAAAAIRHLVAERDRLEGLLGKLLANLDGLDDYMKQPERGGYGVECAVCMNEWIEPEDRADMEAARAALSGRKEP